MVMKRRLNTRCRIPARNFFPTTRRDREILFLEKLPIPFIQLPRPRPLALWLLYDYLIELYSFDTSHNEF